MFVKFKCLALLGHGVVIPICFEFRRVRKMDVGEGVLLQVLANCREEKQYILSIVIYHLCR